MMLGCMPLDGGNLLMSPQEYSQLVLEQPQSKEFLKKITGSKEYINGLDRWCVWIRDDQVNRAIAVPEIVSRIERTRLTRLGSKAPGARKLASKPWSFREQHGGRAIIVPSVSSERREYVPIGYVDENTVISNLAFAIYDAEPWVFAFLTSRMHMAWLRAVGGRMKTDYRYSSTIVYNTFPVPDLSDADKQLLTERAFRVLDVREYHSEKTLAELYDPDLMPENLRLAHQELDVTVDRLYRKRAFVSDEERLALLFKLYEEMTLAKEPRR